MFDEQTKIPANMNDDELLRFLLDTPTPELHFHYSQATPEQLDRWERVLDEYAVQLNKSHLLHMDPPTESIH